MQGSISCLRITKKALGKDGFMRVDNSPPITTAGVVGFWDFKDGEVGELADELDNSASDGIFDGKAAPVGSQGMSPVFSADAPGRFIYADSSAKERIADSPQSLHFAPGTSSGGGGKVELANLSSSLGKIDAYTMEFFFKSETTDTYRTPIGWRLDDNVGFKVNFQSGSVGYLEAVTNNNGQFSNLDYAYLVQDSAFTADAWHHLAVVCDAAKGKMKMYVDYRSPIEIDYDARTTLESFPVTLGTSAFAKREGLEAFGGFISCPRVTARALDIPDFMVARMVETEPGTVFAWNFEEGAGNLAEKIAKACDYADSQADSAALKDAYCQDKNTLPEYAGTSKGARRVLWGGEADVDEFGFVLFPGTAESYGSPVLCRHGNESARIRTSRLQSRKLDDGSVRKARTRILQRNIRCSHFRQDGQYDASRLDYSISAVLLDAYAAAGRKTQALLDAGGPRSV
jgi:hypothetical protein